MFFKWGPNTGCRVEPAYLARTGGAGHSPRIRFQTDSQAVVAPSSSFAAVGPSCTRVAGCTFRPSARTAVQPLRWRRRTDHAPFVGPSELVPMDCSSFAGYFFLLHRRIDYREWVSRALQPFEYKKRRHVWLCYYSNDSLTIMKNIVTRCMANRTNLLLAAAVSLELGAVTSASSQPVPFDRFGGVETGCSAKHPNRNIEKTVMMMCVYQLHYRI